MLLWHQPAVVGDPNDIGGGLRHSEGRLERQKGQEGIEKQWVATEEDR